VTPNQYFLREQPPQPAAAVVGVFMLILVVVFMSLR
jgi:hypothetical protein